MAVALGIVLLKLVILLVAAKLAGEVAERLRQPAVLGELLAGVLLGPSLFGLVDLASADGRLVTFLAQLGAILLLLEVGLETRLRDLASVGMSAGLVALVGIVGSFAFGFGASYLLDVLGLWDGSLLFHVFVGATLTATSVGITARVLSDMGRLATAEARIILGAAVLDDIGGLLILAVVSALAAGAVDPGAIALRAALSAGFLVVAVALGVKLMPRVMDVVMRARSRGVLVVAALAFTLAMAYVAELTGLASIVGAFAAGLILAQTRQQPALHEKTRALGELLVPLFFVYVGLQVDLRGAGENALPLLAAALVLLAAGILGKLASGLAVVERGTSRWAVGVGMVPRGEVGLIFALVGLTSGLVAGWQYTALLLVVALTTFITPLWLKVVLARGRSGPDQGEIVMDADAHGSPIARPRSHRPRKGPDWGRKD